MQFVFLEAIATQAEAAQLAALHRDAFAPHAAWSTSEFQSIEDHPGRIVVTDSARQAAILVLQFSADEAEVLTLGVVPSVRRSGIARAVLCYGIRLAANQGVRRMFLEVATDNVPAIKLYHAMDFDDVGRRKRYYQRADGSRIDAIVMARDVGA